MALLQEVLKQGALATHQEHRPPTATAGLTAVGRRHRRPPRFPLYKTLVLPAPKPPTQYRRGGMPLPCLFGAGKRTSRRGHRRPCVRLPCMGPAHADVNGAPRIAHFVGGSEETDRQLCPPPAPPPFRKQTASGMPSGVRSTFVKPKTVIAATPSSVSRGSDGPSPNVCLLTRRHRADPTSLYYYGTGGRKSIVKLALACHVFSYLHMPDRSTAGKVPHSCRFQV
jgi:hypothetical protein